MKATFKVPADKEHVLSTLNFVAVLTHALLCVAAFVVAGIYAADSPMAQITLDFRRFDPMSAAPPSAGPVTTTLESVAYYQLIWLLPVPSALAVVYHAIIIGLRKRYMDQVLKQNRNDLRWFEYAHSMSLIMWVVLQVAGVTNLFMLLGVGVGFTWAIQMGAYAMETINTRTAIKARGVRFYWFPGLMSGILLAAQWAVAIAYFAVGVAQPRSPGARGIEWFEYAIMVGCALLALANWILFMTHVSRSERTAYRKEILYIILSFITKSWPLWVMLLGMLTVPF